MFQVLIDNHGERIVGIPTAQQCTHFRARRRPAQGQFGNSVVDGLRYVSRRSLVAHRIDDIVQIVQHILQLVRRHLQTGLT